MKSRSIAMPQALDRVILLFIAVTAVLLIAFVDEGRNSFSWMKNAGDWITTGIFTLVIFAGQLLCWRVLGDGFDRSVRIFFSAVGGFVFFGLFMMAYVMVLMAVR